MSDSIRTPVIVAEGQDVSIFDSVDEAEEHLTRHPSPEGAKAMFDARGRVLKIDAAASSSPSGASPAAGLPVRLVPAEPPRAREEDLIRLLQEYLQACGERIRPGAPLAELIRRCRSIQLYRE